MRWRCSSYRLRAQDGAALVLSLIILFSLTLTATAVVVRSSSNTNSARYGDADANALSLGEAGLAEALSVIGNPANDPEDATLLPASPTPATTHTYSTGTATYSGVYDAPTRTWSLSASGSVDNRAGTGTITREVAQQVYVEIPTTANNPPGTTSSPTTRRAA